jgi:hypothetical protein
MRSADAPDRVNDPRVGAAALKREFTLLDRALQRRPDADVTFDASSVPARVLAALRASWRERAIMEYRSTTLFAAIANQLVIAGEPPETTAVMLRMAQDEARHGARCLAVVRALGGDASLPTELGVEPLAEHEGTTPRERVLRNVLYTTCLSEMVAIAQFVDTLEHTREPYFHEQLRQLLADEILHGQFGFHYLDSIRPWLVDHPQVVESTAEYLQFAFGVLEAALAPPLPAQLPELPDDALRVGLSDPRRRRDVFYATIEEAIVPGLERFGIAAARAWTSRRRVLPG